MRITRKYRFILLLILLSSLLVLGYQQCAPFSSKIIKRNLSSEGSDDEGTPGTCDIQNINYQTDITPIFRTYCISCHSSGPNNLAPLLYEASARDHIELFENSLDQIERYAMPPNYASAPSACDRQKMQAWLNPQAPVNCSADRPQRTTISRLTNVEYDNTIADLTGLIINPLPSSGFLADFGGAGFDNVSSGQVFSELHMERYLNAAIRIVSTVFSDTSAKARVMICSQQTTSCAQQIFSAFGKKAFRRPLSVAELNQLTSYLGVASSMGDSFQVGIQLGLQKILVSPAFLYRIVFDYIPSAPGAVYQLSSYELASRLSYFLWNSIPDEMLLQDAANDRLRDPIVLAQHVQRMLASPKAYNAFSSNFLMQWTRVRNFEDHLKEDPNYYRQFFPEFTSLLGKNMVGETKRFFTDIIAHDRSVIDILTSNYSFLTPELGNLYGINVQGSGFQRVQLNGQRKGLLTQASLLAQSSAPNQRDIIRRGLLVLDQIACWKLGSRPDNVPPINMEPGPIHSLREIYSIHARSTDCAACHNKIDPLGFAFEKYNGIGKWQTSEFGQPLDSSGTLPDGRSFSDAMGLIDRVIENKDYQKCITQKMMTYALGRGVENSDQCTVNQIVNETTNQQDRFSDFIKAIVTSDAFMKSSGQ